LKIQVADYSGFCFGVKKAVSAVYDASADVKGKIYTYGPIIHNSEVVKKLEQRGVKVLDSIDELKENDTIVIRSHGVPKAVIEALKSKNVNIIDATCPFVDYIHKKVEEYYTKGYQILIIGDPEHPEVKGINGWCDNNAIIINSKEEVDNLKTYSKVCIVSQTTTSLCKWSNIVPSLLFISKEIVLLNTICSATEQRQKSAEELAKNCDAVIVLGGYNSSNTQKLVEICKKYCPKTYHIENINELNFDDFKEVNTLGITAGASTPDWIIKEAINKMSNMINTNEENNEKSLLMDEYEKTFTSIHQGDIVKGRIIYVNDEEASVDIGYKADGIISRAEASLTGDISPRDIFKPGDEVEVYILKVNDGEGNVMLSKKMADAEKNLEYIEECYKNKTVVDARVIEAVKGGVIAEVRGVQVFIPASQLNNKYVEDLSSFVKKEMRILITDFNPDKRRIIGSRRIVLEEEIKNKKKDLLDKLEVGNVITGTVSRITDFGVFLDLGGIDGLIHISELSWARIKHPSEIVKVGDTVEAYVLSVDKEKERVSLSLKKTIAEPWDNISEKIHVGEIINGKVVRIAPFGAFIEIEPGVDGLVHISQISPKRINKIEDVLSVGDNIKAKVLDINTADKKISLSIREAIEDEEKEQNQQILDNQPEQPGITIKDVVENKEIK